MTDQEWNWYFNKRNAEFISPDILKIELGEMSEYENNADDCTTWEETPLHKPGTLLILRHQCYMGNAFEVDHCENITFKEVTVFTAPGMGIHAARSKNFLLDNFSTIRKPGTGRRMSVTVDSTHFNTCSGDIVIKNSTFECMGDDAVNIHGMYMRIHEKVGENTLKVRGNGRYVGPLPEVGERFELSRGNSMRPYGEAIVKRVVFDEETKIVLIEFDKPLPEEVEINDLVTSLDAVPRVRISNCTVRNNRARGMLLQSRDMIIENNLFQNCSAAALHITCDNFYWFEAIGTRDVTIRNNTILDCNRGVAMQEAAINVFAHCPTGSEVYTTLAPFGGPGAHQNIKIIDNFISGSKNAGIHVSSTEGLTITGNILESYCEAPTREEGKAGIYIQNTLDATITENQFLQSREDAEMIIIGKGCSEKTFLIENNKVF